MPLFAFECAACGHAVELLVRADARPACPACGAPGMEKQLSHFAAVAGGRPEPAGCGAPSCCQLRGGCGMN
jgi:putative FmdB family regulatory protein